MRKALTSYDSIATRQSRSGRGFHEPDVTQLLEHKMNRAPYDSRTTVPDEPCQLCKQFNHPNDKCHTYQEQD